MNKDNSILIASVIFPDNLCDEVINIFENKSKGFKDLRYFHRNQKGVRRKDEACFLDDFYIDLRNDNGDDNISDKVNNHLMIALEEYVHNYPSIENIAIRTVRQKLQKTEKGGGFHAWHHEQTDLNLATRVLTWSIYLNDVEEGGETEFLHQSKRVKAKKGRIVLFPASFTHAHRGNPPLSGDKYILTGWFNLF